MATCARGGAVRTLFPDGALFFGLKVLWFLQGHNPASVRRRMQLISQRPAGRHHKIDSKMTRAEEELEEPRVGC